ncbi:MAG: biopolymer transporter ExbD [Negativicutes bacterium]|nr:biopolymer transporter ExbD [Negativicutes bacterium]
MKPTGCCSAVDGEAVTLDKLRQTPPPRLMIIPMIDIILFLLVFFMISTLYMVEQNLLPVSLPAARSDDRPAGWLVNVTVTADGRIMIDNQPVDAAGLAGQVAAAVAAHPDTVVIIRADRQLPYQQVVALLDQLRTAGVSRLALAATGQ